MRGILRGRVLRLPVVSVVVLAVSAGIAVGAGVVTTPWQDASGVYHACVLTKVGTMRVIDTTLPASSPLQHCTSLETEITWNRVGPQGAQGIQGLPGSQGAQGPQGEKGDPGKDAPTYSAAGGLTLDGTTFKVAPGGITGGPNGLVAPLTITSGEIANGAVSGAKLGSILWTATTTAAASVPAAIPAGGTGEFALTVSEITESDLMSVNTSPTTPLPSGLLITNTFVDALGGLVHVRVYNSTGAPITPTNIDWKVLYTHFR
jgi:hypothetical protein